MIKLTHFFQHTLTEIERQRGRVRGEKSERIIEKKRTRVRVRARANASEIYSGYVWLCACMQACVRVCVNQKPRVLVFANEALKSQSLM